MKGPKLTKLGDVKSINIVNKKEDNFKGYHNVNSKDLEKKNSRGCQPLSSPRRLSPLSDERVRVRPREIEAGEPAKKRESEKRGGREREES